MTIPDVMYACLTFASAGGGGSSSGGGGGGGGSLIIVIGYMPAYYATVWSLKYLKMRQVALCTGVVVGLLVTIPFLLLNVSIGLLVGLGAGAGVYSGMKDLFGKLMRRIKATKKNIAVAAQKDVAWHEDTLNQRVQEVFMAFQTDWSNFALDRIATYTTPRYYQHVSLMLAAMKLMGRRNNVLQPRILKQAFVEARDDLRNNDRDRFEVALEMQANDCLIDTRTNTIIHATTKPFSEFWNFVRSGDTWLLDGIDQPTANKMLARQSMAVFAAQNGMFYSVDWGRLLLPQRGQLFSTASLKSSDVNNHVIGSWNGIIVQFYTYVPVPSRALDDYLIAQISLPKAYGGIIIKRREKLNWHTVISFPRRAPRGYKKVTFEWPQFNERYKVYATDLDRVTSFELLNPKFMADLYDKNLKVEIEVIDTTVYLYSKEAQGEMRYAEMLEILRQAFKELKL